MASVVLRSRRTAKVGRQDVTMVLSYLCTGRRTSSTHVSNTQAAQHEVLPIKLKHVVPCWIPFFGIVYSRGICTYCRTNTNFVIPCLQFRPPFPPPFTLSLLTTGCTCHNFTRQYLFLLSCSLRPLNTQYITRSHIIRSVLAVMRLYSVIS